jgi:toxin-antitoxin system PIN domain toxin
VILADVNVLVYAFRPDSSEHARCRAWLEGVVGGPEAFGVSPQVLSSVIRICTNPRAFARPSLLEVVMAFCRGLLEEPHARLVSPGDRHWDIFEDLCRRSAARGNLVPDAWFAALAIESGCEWITLDRDFARFPGLRWRTP